MLSRFLAWIGLAIASLFVGWRLGGRTMRRRYGLASGTPYATTAIDGFDPSGRRHLGTTAIVFLAVALIAAGATAVLLQVRRERETRTLVAKLTGGDASRGPALAINYGCAGCHTISGVRGPRGKVGPPLDGIAGRVYLGGRVANTPDNLIQWIVNPREIDPNTAMPPTGISKRDARDMAAYLLTLK